MSRLEFDIYRLERAIEANRRIPDSERDLMSDCEELFIDDVQAARPDLSDETISRCYHAGDSYLITIGSIE